MSAPAPHPKAPDPIDRLITAVAVMERLIVAVEALVKLLTTGAGSREPGAIHAAGYQQQGVTIYDAGGNLVTAGNPFPVTSPGLPVDAASRPMTAQDLLDALAALTSQVQAAATPAASTDVGSVLSVINPLDSLNAVPFDLAPLSAASWSGQNLSFW